MSRKIILIGGSAGSFRPVCTILGALRPGFSLPVVLVLHRLKNINSGFKEALNSTLAARRVTEPFDKEKIADGRIYLAPANYHLCFEDTGTFALSTDLPVQYSRPSIDLAFFSAAEKFGRDVTAVILSGANNDGVAGAKRIGEKGGKVLVQDPKECEVETMPSGAIRHVDGANVLGVKEIVAFLNAEDERR